ncbi:MAG: leucine-rich repeat protein [Oscillospiraceae bacterium]|nr:leucine-rich repeat protein [Oscillospiraceae bacterium]
MKCSKILAFLLAFCLVASLAPCALADDETSGTCGENLTWVLEDGVLTISGTGEMNDYSAGNTPWYAVQAEITSVTIESGVTSIGKEAFSGCTALTGIAIPEGVTGIGEYSFYNCSSLADITIADTVNSIGSGAFSGTAYANDSANWDGDALYLDHWLIRANEDITDAYEVKAGTFGIADYTFYYHSSLTDVTIPEGVAYIGYEAFYGCSALVSVTIPVSVVSIGEAALGYCSSLTDVYYGGDKADWDAIEIGKNNATLTSATLHYADAAGESSAAAFLDVDASDYCYTPVAWALEQGITTGTTTTTFSPSETCTRGQIITFLWRANGSPAPAGSGAFSDVEAGVYYADAVQWASEQGIDLSSGTFRPDAPCTRATVVEYLYRLAGSPTVATESGFSDISSTDTYADAVAWAVESGITTGTTTTTFSPSETCTRGQIVTFLYRALA